MCQTWEASEGKERAASEMADLLYHAMVLLNVQVSLIENYCSLTHTGTLHLCMGLMVMFAGCFCYIMYVTLHWARCIHCVVGERFVMICRQGVP